MIQVPFFEFDHTEPNLKKDIELAIKKTISRGKYILGGEVKQFEKKFARYLGVKFAVGVASGTDAIHLALLACEVRSGDEVITVANTCVPTLSAILACGAKPVLVDIDRDTYCLDLESVKKKITAKTKAIVPVHLYGHVVNMGPLLKLCRKYKIAVIEDCAQAHGAQYKGKKAGSMGLVGAFSFYPTKNLGALGDAGLIATNNKKIAEKCKLLRNYGQKNRYEHLLAGFNSRLDELQAAILNAKLKKLDKLNNKRRAIAKLYCEQIKNPHIQLPHEAHYAFHIWHLFVIQSDSRDELRGWLKENEIESLIHYPIPLHKQRFFLESSFRKKPCPVAENQAKKILSIPLYPTMNQKQIQYVIQTLNSYRA